MNCGTLLHMHTRASVCVERLSEAIDQCAANAAVALVWHGTVRIIVTVLSLLTVGETSEGGGKGSGPP